MLLTEPRVGIAELEARTGWAIKPQGACRGEVCVPLPADASDGGSVDAKVLAERIGAPLVRDDRRGVWSLGPAVGPTGRALTTAEAPELRLPDLDGNAFALSSLRGRKVLLLAWASW